MNRPELKAIALDFDGTLVESNHIKDQAFEVIFSDWPEHRDGMIAWHLARNSVNRMEKFRYFVEDVLKQSGNKLLIEQLAARFSELTRREIILCPMVLGAQEFLDYYLGKLPMYLLSATPQTELNFILKERRLKKYFNEIFGAPINKAEILNQIISIENLSPNELLYIGDSPEDQQAAALVGTRFIARRSDRTLDYSGIHAYANFTCIHQEVESIYEI